MNVWLLLALSAAGGFGAVCRFACDTFIAPHARLPLAIMIVNLTGSFAAGIVAGVAGQLIPEEAAAVITTGFLGGYTTFSTVSLHTAQYVLNKEWSNALFTGVAQLIASITLAVLGLFIGAMLL